MKRFLPAVVAVLVLVALAVVLRDGDRPPERHVPLGAAVSTRWLDSDARYRRVIARNFDSVTPENELKMAYTQPRRGRYDFGPADRVVDEARLRGKEVRGHTLVWHGQIPRWVTRGGLGKRALARVMREHIATVVRRYRGKVHEWDVVNEALEDFGGWRPSVWYRTLGPGYVEQAFQAAHAADPSARLYYNDNLGRDRAAKWLAIRRLVVYLKRQGVPIHGVGIQNHVTTASYPGREEMETNLRLLEKLGVDVQITEMDVTTSQGPSEDALGLQARAYRDAAEACAAVRACKRFTVWGVADQFSWRGGHERPLLFDSHYRRKPAYAPLREALGGSG